MVYVGTDIAAVLYETQKNSIVQAIKRGSDRYSYIYVDGKGRGGKKLLIGVSKTVLSEAMSSGKVDEDIVTHDEAGLSCEFKAVETCISDSKQAVAVCGADVSQKQEETRKTSEVVAPDMSEYLNATQVQREKALLRMEVVEGYEDRDKRITAKQFIDGLSSEFSLIMVTEMKLFRWKKAVEASKSEGTSPLVALLDKRGTKKGVTKLSADQQEMAVRMLCRRDNPLRVSAIYQNMLHAYGESMVSYDVLNNFLKRWKKANASLFEFAQDADGWKNSRMAGFGSLSEKAKYANHYWELDSTPADVITKDGKRYAILGMIDVFSRRPVFWVDERSSSYSIARLLRKAILKLGIPEYAVIDNGKDYKSNHFASICYNLGIKQETVPPFSGDMKPHIERIFGTMSRELFEELEGYTGHSVAERTQIESRRGFAHKIQSKAKWYAEVREKEKKSFSEGFRIKKENLGLEIQVPVDANELQKWVDGWADNIYERREHSTLRMSPLKKWEKSFMPVKAVPDPRMLDILLGESFERKVGKKGIRLQGALYQHVKLAYHVGEHVRIMTDDEMGHVFVYEMNYAPICIAEDYEYTGKSRAQLAEGKRVSHRISREMAKLLEEWEETSRKLDPSIKDRIEREAFAKGQELPAATPAVAKHTQVMRGVMEASQTFAAQDKQSAQESNVVSMEGEKLMPSGRPVFKNFYDRLLWDLNNDRVDEGTMKIANAHPDLWEMAQKEKKIG